MILGNVEITNNLPESLGRFFSVQSYSKVAVLVDENTRQHCYPKVVAHLPEHSVIEIKSGEEEKTLRTCEHIWNELTKLECDRKALLVNLGGGVIGDMGGFCAATYKRGIKFLNLPTTLLAQVDASVGGKLGIDFHGLKNHIGVFQEPERVIVSSGFLATLPERELRSGFAEVLKHALIADASYWKTLTAKPFEEQPWNDHIQHSIEVKSGVVDKDPKENGLRKILNFGHTIGHAVETALLVSGNRLLHGEAIAIGMITEAFLSTKKTGLPQGSYEEITQYLLATYHPAQISEATIKKAESLILQDKKNEKATIKGSLLSAIGQSEYDVIITLGEVREALAEFNSVVNLSSAK
ncbi:MAG: 3-dehydroquinate synthase [Imperialibacter sp.]|uniref:3-dehydroquinate synthase n=1 Tax=Imperialibacter sp. TaxID=2038411 RepID=UPI0032EB0D0A